MQPECKVSVNIFFALFISLLFNSLMKEMPSLSSFLFAVFAFSEDLG